MVGVPARLVAEVEQVVLGAVPVAVVATMLSVCSGVFVLGAAGLLDGRRCTSHWVNVEELAERYPDAQINPDVLFVDDGDLITSAGTAAGIDACLHLVRRELGSAVATRIARRMVVPPQRDGGQRQYVDLPVPETSAESRQPVLHARNLLEQTDLGVESVATRSGFGTAALLRHHFRRAVGVAPQDYRRTFSST